VQQGRNPHALPNPDANHRAIDADTHTGTTGAVDVGLGLGFHHETRVGP